MHTQYRTLLSCLTHYFLIFAFVIFAATIVVELGPAAFGSRAVSNATLNAADRNAQSANRSTASYHWNLNDDGMPLISLPEHIAGGLDLSLTYPLNEFEFPLFQSLHFNERARKYMLMVLPRNEVDVSRGRTTERIGRRALFIELLAAGGDEQFAAAGKVKLRLTDRGGVKLLSTNDGTTYTFATFADGELRCSRIVSAHDVVINLRYASDASLRTITDSSDRTMTFGYTDDYLTSVTQTWGSRKKLRQTWTIADDVRFAHASSPYVAPATLPLAKHIPANAIKPRYTSQMAVSDAALAILFGGPGAIAAANGFEPAGLGSQYPLYRGDLIADDGRVLRGHLSFAMHLYGSTDGRGETELYVPAGFVSHSKGPSPTDAAVLFYYPRLGNLTDVTLAVFHVKNFQLSYDGERVRIGNIGGPGGSASSYKHSHLEFYRGQTGLPSPSARVELRIDPTSVFASSTVARNRALQITSGSSRGTHQSR